MRHPAAGDPPLYREIEHTADCGIVVEAGTAAALFEKAALALGALMVHPAGVEAREERLMAANADDWPDLLHHWLAEVLAAFAMDGFLAAAVTIGAIGPTSVSGTFLGERFDPARHEYQGEVKAVTYHELAVSEDPDAWRARVIFDV